MNVDINTFTSNLEWALYYASLGRDVFPIKTKTKDRFFKDKEHPGPNGNIYSWKAQATTDQERIIKYWTQHPDANIGMGTGKSTGVVAIDIDLDEDTGEDGYQTIKAWEAEHGPLPDTWRDLSGRGGARLYYRIPEGKEYKNAQAGDVIGIDIRGNGGYTLLAPSIHPNGKPYTWECGFGPDEVEMATVDDNVQAFLDYVYRIAGSRKMVKTEDGEHVLIGKGGRHDYLTSQVGILVNKNWDTMTDDEITAVVMMKYETDLDHSVPFSKSKEDTEREMRELVASCRARDEEQRQKESEIDYKYAVRVYRRNHPDEKLPEKIPPEKWAEIKAEGLKAKEAGEQPDVPATTDPQPGTQPCPQHVVNGWRQPSITRYKDKEGKVKTAQTVSNMVEAIQYDQELFGHIRYNTMSYAPCIVGPLPWKKDALYREWKNSDDAQLRLFLEETYCLTSKEKMLDALTIVTERNAFNPVALALDLIHKEWDGQAGHIRALLPEYLGCEDNEYNFEAMKLFMLGAIKRVFQPGAKFDYMLVLVGQQGVGKSTFLRYLAINPEWYNDNLNTITDDKGSEKIRGFWIVELAELLATKKTKDVESIKAFITSRVDAFRPPYGKRNERFPRVCVFAGTTNDEGFLTDRTGNRRFLPITTRKEYRRKSLFGDQEAVVNDFKQAWGEAMDLFLMDPSQGLVLPSSLDQEVLTIQESYMVDDYRVGVIQKWLDEYKGDTVCVPQLFKEALGNLGGPQRYESNEIHTIMANSIKGWKLAPGSHKMRCGVYGPQKAYIRESAEVRNTQAKVRNTQEQLDLEDLGDETLPFG